MRARKGGGREGEREKQRKLTVYLERACERSLSQMVHTREGARGLTRR